jgi:thiamine pyrophosphate-dependent acetolactate synthase large subunit-like protein
MEKKRVFGTGGELLVHQLVAQGVRNFHTFGGEMAKQKKYPEVYLGDPEIDFVMLAKAQGIEGTAVREPQAIEAALRRGADAINAGEPYLLDIRVATVGTGAESTWHQRFKLRE